MNRALLLGATVLVSCVCSVAGAQGDSVVGSWKLVSYDTTTPDGVKTFPLGDDAVGQLIYLASGRMSVQFMRRDRPKFKSGDAWRGTLEEERAAFEGFFSYAGRYTIDAARGTVTHHIEISAAPNYVGTDVVRNFTMQGNHIILKTPQRALAGQTSSSTLIWERID
ncbi:MAG: lipocalin-like domain-containing protein [Acidimicrobiia bacterium]